MTEAKPPVFRRIIDIVNHTESDGGRVRVALEDDYHHFRVQVDYSNGRVLDVSGEAFRSPYTICGEANAVLPQLRGMALSPNSVAAARFGDQRQHCTHMLDEAGLAVAAAANGIARRRYEIEVPRHIDGCTHARLWRDGTQYLEWDVREYTIESPPPYAGLNLGRGMSRWVQDNLNDEQAEAALVLRRCAMISLGRLHNLDLEVHAKSSGFCYAQQAHRAEQALRVKGSTLDFSDKRGALIASDRNWLDESA